MNSRRSAVLLLLTAALAMPLRAGVFGDDRPEFPSMEAFNGKELQDLKSRYGASLPYRPDAMKMSPAEMFDDGTIWAARNSETGDAAAEAFFMRYLEDALGPWTASDCRKRVARRASLGADFMPAGLLNCYLERDASEGSLPPENFRRAQEAVFALGLIYSRKKTALHDDLSDSQAINAMRAFESVRRSFTVVGPDGYLEEFRSAVHAMRLRLAKKDLFVARYLVDIDDDHWVMSRLNSLLGSATPDAAYARHSREKWAAARERLENFMQARSRGLAVESMDIADDPKVIEYLEEILRMARTPVPAENSDGQLVTIDMDNVDRSLRDPEVRECLESAFKRRSCFWCGESAQQRLTGLDLDGLVAAAKTPDSDPEMRSYLGKVLSQARCYSHRAKDEDKKWVADTAERLIEQSGKSAATPRGE